MEKYNIYWEKNKNNSSIVLPKRGIKSRIAILKEVLKGKKVLHIGCSDWPDTGNKIKNNELLRQYLINTAKTLYGIDKSEKGISTMLKNGIKNVFVGDIYKLCENKDLVDKNFDVLLVSEIMEHILNPGQALISIKKYVLRTNPNCEIVFTVPNYHNFLFNTVYGLTCREAVNPDHKFYFSYRTFRNLVESCGYKVEDFYFVTYGKGAKSLKERIFIKLFGYFLQCMLPHLYFKCRLNNQDQNAF